jgi:hypothetical protein
MHLRYEQVEFVGELGLLSTESIGFAGYASFDRDLFGDCLKLQLLNVFCDSSPRSVFSSCTWTDHLVCQYLGIEII